MKLAAAFLILLGFAVALKAQKAAADLIVVNANVRTINRLKPRAEAIAVAGNKIIAVGTNKQILALAGKNTKTIDAKGKLLIPGFNDAHVHFTGIGNQFSSMDLRTLKTPQDFVEKIKFYTQFLPKNRWILGSGWKAENWTPTRDLIDAATLEHPVFIYSADGRTALANSLALRLAGIDKNSRVNGISRNASGEPNGIVQDLALARVRAFVPNQKVRNWTDIIETATNYAASLGVTSVQDVHSDDFIETYRALEREGKLKTRVYDCINLFEWKKSAGAKLKRATGDAMIRGGCLKSFSDGDKEAVPAIFETIQAADKAGLQVMMHAIGGAANDVILSVFERVTKANGTRDRRFRVEHAHNFRAQDLRRFAASKIIASMQPHLFYGNEPYRELLASGADLAFGSDASITDFNPLFGIYAASGDNSASDTQAISVEEAVRAYTLGSAFAEFQEDVKGSIEVGKLADFVILSEDIFTAKHEAIRNAKVLMTVLDGKIVFEREINRDERDKQG